MNGEADAELERALADFAPTGLLVGTRLIAAGDENALLPEEAATIGSSVIEKRRASGATRILARSLLAKLGHAQTALPKSEAGAPIWPAGIVGSLAHDDDVAVAAVGLTRDFRAIGIDVEPTAPLAAEMLDLVVIPQERAAISGELFRAKLLFALKEAVYKATYPLDGVFLEFHDITVDLAANTATTRTGRTLTLRHIITPRIVALAFA